MENTENTTPDLQESEQKEITIPVKYNKEIKELSLADATALAQKGLKFESIEKDFGALKELAARESKSVPAFISNLCDRYNEDKRKALIEECGGNEEIAEKLLSLENSQNTNGLQELTEAFPEIKSLEDLPEEVLEKTELKGTLPLDEYLRYLLQQNRNKKAFAAKLQQSEKASTGSLLNLRGTDNPETEEFLRGLWK